MPEPTKISREAAEARSVVIIPTYNESSNIRTVLYTVLQLPMNLSALVIDDNSQDGTAEMVKELMQRFPGRLHLIQRPGKLGLGTAYVHGFREVLRQGYDLVCEMDADLSHNPADLPRLIDPVASGEADMTIGSRYVQGVRVINWPLSRLVLSYGAGIYTRLITRLPVKDATAGFKCFHRRVLESIDLDRVKSNGYSFQVEMNYRAWRKGFRLKEIPIIFTERSEGHSKMSKAIVREAAFKVWELRLRALTRTL